MPRTVQSTQDITIEIKDLDAQIFQTSVRAMYQEIVEHELVLDGPFQRDYIWDEAKASRIIESLYMRIPIPIIYLVINERGEKYVLDGRQRLTSIFYFLAGYFREPNKKFVLHGLTHLRNLNYRSFGSLPEQIQRALRDAPLTVALIRNASDEKIRDIFSRLNMSPSPLNTMELRNSDYYGPYMECIKRLSNAHNYQEILQTKIQQKLRMYNRIQVMRFAALYHQGVEAYKEPLKKFLDSEAAKYCNEDADFCTNLEQAFYAGLKNNILLFGPKAFRRFVGGNEENPRGSWNSDFHGMVHEVMMNLLHDKNYDELRAHRDGIREGFVHFMATSVALSQYITYGQGTSRAIAVRGRYNLMKSQLDFILSKMRKKEGEFRLQDKNRLWSKENTCVVCQTPIEDIDDAAIYGKRDYWAQAVTDFDRLAHRYCSTKLS